MVAVETVMNKHSMLFRLFELINNASDEQQLQLLRQLHRGRLDNAVFKLIVDMSSDQQHRLLKQLNQMALQDRPEQTIDLDERQAPRKKCIIPVNYLDGQQTRQSRIVDISTLGVFIETPYPMEVGQKLVMRFSFPKKEKLLKIRGQITRKESKGIGVKFDQLAQLEMDLIQTFVDGQ